MFTVDGKMVAAAGPTSDASQHPAWSTYFCSNDADATARAVTAAGGQVVMGPMDVMGQGRMAVFTDSTGAYFSVWQPQLHKGAELVNAPGSFGWNELYTRDVPASQEFYRKVLGLDVEESEYGGGAYTLFQVDGKNVAGGLDMTSMLPDSIPPHWLVYFVVEKTANTVAKARELGGNVTAGPMDTPMGSMAVIQDPVGAAFAVIQAMP